MRIFDAIKSDSYCKRPPNHDFKSSKQNALVSRKKTKKNAPPPPENLAPPLIPLIGVIVYVVNLAKCIQGRAKKKQFLKKCSLGQAWKTRKTKKTKKRPITKKSN